MEFGVGEEDDGGYGGTIECSITYGGEGGREGDGGERCAVLECVSTYGGEGVGEGDGGEVGTVLLECGIGDVGDSAIGGEGECRDAGFDVHSVF